MQGTTDKPIGHTELLNNLVKREKSLWQVVYYLRSRVLE